MKDNSNKVKEYIKKIANGKQGLRFPVMSGVVKAGSIDTENMVCTVLLGVNDESAPTGGIMLNAVTLNTNGMVLYPADGSNVWVAEVDAPGGKWGVIKCSNLVKMQVTIGGSQFTITDGLIQMNDGSKNGLVVVNDLVTRLNKLEQDNNKLKAAFNTWIVVANDGGSALKVAATTWTASTLTETAASDIENTAITQG